MACCEASWALAKHHFCVKFLVFERYNRSNAARMLENVTEWFPGALGRVPVGVRVFGGTLGLILT